jgi:hypothetical protein
MPQLEAAAAAEAIREAYEKRPGVEAGQLHQEVFLVEVAGVLKTAPLPSNLKAIADLLDAEKIEAPFSEYPKWVKQGGKIERDAHGVVIQPKLPEGVTEWTLDKDDEIWIIINDPALDKAPAKKTA